MFDSILSAAESFWNIAGGVVIALLFIRMGAIGVLLIAHDYYLRRHALRVEGMRIGFQAVEGGYSAPVYEYRLPNGKRYEALGAAGEGFLSSRIGETFELFVFEHDPANIFEPGCWRAWLGVFFLFSVSGWLYSAMADSATPVALRWIVAAAALCYWTRSFYKRTWHGAHESL